ncbi:MAG: transglycosylase SLT domain-containing protein [Pseudolabrys sp.]
MQTPQAAIAASARLLRNLVRQFGNLGLAAAAYNAGPRRIQDWLAWKGNARGNSALRENDYLPAGGKLEGGQGRLFGFKTCRARRLAKMPPG